MNNAEPDAVCSDDYMAQHDMVYRLNAEERAYCHQLTDFGEELSFLKFLAGAKLRQFDGMSWHECKSHFSRPTKSLMILRVPNASGRVRGSLGRRAHG